MLFLDVSSERAVNAFCKVGFWISKSHGKRHVGMSNGTRKIVIPRHKRLIPFRVYGFNLLCLGITIFLVPLLIPTCLFPWLFEIQNPTLQKALTARSDETSVKSIGYANTTSTSLISAPLNSSFSISK